MSELKPCPFCNAPARLVLGRVKCTRQSCGTCGGRFDHVSVSIAAWNDRTPAPSESARGDGETWASIAQWCEDTFGPVTLKRTAERANEEMIELLEKPDDVIEAADVLIVLSRYPGLWEAVERKMAINRARVWDVKGDGTGYHVPQPASLSGSDR